MHDIASAPALAMSSILPYALGPEPYALYSYVFSSLCERLDLALLVMRVVVG